MWVSLFAAVVVFGATRWLVARQAPRARYQIAAAGSLGCLSTSLLMLTTANLIEGTPMVDPHAMVRAVIADAPAAKAGVLPGDRIVAIDGIEVVSGEIPQRIGAVPASLSCELTLERDGAVQKLRVTPQAGRIGAELGEEPRLVQGAGIAIVGGVVAWATQLGSIAPSQPLGTIVVATSRPASLHATIRPMSATLFWFGLLALGPALVIARRQNRQAA